MATSGVYGFFVTRNDIIREALLNIGKIDGIDPIEDVISNDVLRKLNLLIKQWQGKADFAPGLKVWTRRRGHLFLEKTRSRYTITPTAVGWALDPVQTATTATAPPASLTVVVESATGISQADHIGVLLDSGDLFWSTVSLVAGLTITLSDPLPSSLSSGAVVFAYTYTPQTPLLIEGAYLRDREVNDVPVTRLLSEEYDDLPSKNNPSNSGDPAAIYYEPRLGSAYLYTDVARIEDASKHLVLTFMEPIQDFVNATDEPYYPQEWYRPLCWGLARECAPMFNALWGPVHESNYKDSLSIAQQKDPSNSVAYFQCGAE